MCIVIFGSLDIWRNTDVFPPSAGDHAYKTNKSLPLTEQMISPVPDIKTLTIDPATDPFMVLACDGIWNSLSSQEVVDFISERLDAKNPPAKLTSICEEVRI